VQEGKASIRASVSKQSRDGIQRDNRNVVHLRTAAVKGGKRKKKGSSGTAKGGLEESKGIFQYIYGFPADGSVEFTKGGVGGGVSSRDRYGLGV